MKKKEDKQQETERETTAEEEAEELEKTRFRKEQFTDYLKYMFSDKEKMELGLKLAQCFSDCSEAEGRLKSVTTQIKSEIAKMEGEKTSLSEKIRTGYEHRNVKCERTYDYRLGTVTYIRLDTGELYRDRPMDEQERQQELPFNESETQKAAA